jgi:hypothetical protein
MSSYPDCNTVQNSTQVPAYPIQPSACPEVWAGKMDVTVVYPELPCEFADKDALIAIRNNGDIEVIHRLGMLVNPEARFSKHGAILTGYTPFLLDEGYPVLYNTDAGAALDKSGEHARPVYGNKYTVLGISKKAYAAAVLFAEEVKERAWCGVKPTPIPPAPPLIDLRDIPFSVVIA